ncbi:MAG: transposase [Bacteroidota bacterium]
MSTKKVLEQIFAKLSGTSKWQLDFFIELFDLVYSIQGRLNVQNLTRYSDFNASTFSRHFKKFFDWLEFNWLLIAFAHGTPNDQFIVAIDCSFIAKSGKKTYGLDRFWSGCLGRAKKGLEISLISLIHVQTRKAWALDCQQTPAGLSRKEHDQKQTRIDFYMRQIENCASKLLKVRYIVADGFYAKTKVFDTITRMNKHLITKLRPDANLRYLYQGPHPNRQGRKKTYDGKVDFYDLERWTFNGYLDNHLEVYSVICNSPKFKRNLKVVMILNTKTNKHVLLASTDLELDTMVIIDYYRLRFKIEFIFRDAKQYTGLNHCQARSKEKLNFHFNLSLAAVNMAQYQMMINPTIMSINTIKRLAYNTRFADFLFKQLRPLSKVDFISTQFSKAMEFGRMWQAA